MAPTHAAIAASLAVLACSVLVAPAAAGLSCLAYTATLDGSGDAGCNSTTASQDDLFTVTGSTNKTAVTVTFTSKAKATVTVEDDGTKSFTLAAGTDYNFTVTDPATKQNCTGTASITPCTPACKDVTTAVTATKNADACSVNIGNLNGSDGYFVKSTIGSSATGVSVARTNGTLISGAAAYPVGTWSAVAAQVTYPNGKTAKITCDVKITDVTPQPGLQVTGNDCYYSNKTGGLRVVISTSTVFMLHSSAPRCGRQFIQPITCTPSPPRGDGRVCSAQFAKGTNSKPTPTAGVDVLKAKAASRQTIIIQAQAANVYGNIGPIAMATVKVYKSHALVPPADKDRCIPVTFTL